MADRRDKEAKVTQVLNSYGDIYIKPVFTDVLGISVLSCVPTHVQF